MKLLIINNIEVPCYNIAVTIIFEGIVIFQFPRIHTSLLIKIEKTLNRPITKFYNGDDVNVIAAELLLPKTRPTSFNKKHNLL